MRNTVNISEYYKQYVSDSHIIIGHNIHGRHVQEYKTKDTKSACKFIIEQIEQFLKTSPCSPNEIAVLIAHEPVVSQITQVNLLLRKAGINVGSIAEQFQTANSTAQRQLVTVDCSASVLSCEWPIVFVIDASNCSFSESVASPIVACSRAVSSLFVVNTQECNYPKYLRRCFPLSYKICNKVFPEIFFAFRQHSDGFHFNDLIGEINLNRLSRLLFQIFFWITWVYLFAFYPTYLLINLFLFLSPSIFYPNLVAEIFFAMFIFIIAVLCAVSAVMSISGKYNRWLYLCLNFIIVFSHAAFISLSITYFGNNFDGFIILVIVFFIVLALILHIGSSIVRIKAMNRNWVTVYLETSSALLFFLRLYFNNLAPSFLVFVLTLLTVLPLFNFSPVANMFFIFYFSPMLFNGFKSWMRAKDFKSVTIYSSRCTTV